MFVESAAWIGRALEGIPLGPGSTAIDVGSSTLAYRTVEQPHVEQDVFAPLRARGVKVTHLDARDDPGVDVVRDVDRAPVDLSPQLGRFDLVICAGLLSCVREPARAIAIAKGLVAPQGWLVVSTPRSYRRTLDPRDNMLRPDPGELASMITRPAEPPFELVRADAVRINDRRYYRGLRSRLCWVPVRGTWLPLPGFTETIRYRMPGKRWVESCVLLRQTAASREHV